MHVACGVSARPVVSQLVVDLKGASSSSAGRMLWCYHNYMYGWPNGLVPSLGHGTRDRVSGVGGAPLRRGHGPGRSLIRVRGTWWSPGRVLGMSWWCGARIVWNPEVQSMGNSRLIAKRDLDTCTWHVGSQPGRLFHIWWLILKVHHLVLSQTMVDQTG